MSLVIDINIEDSSWEKDIIEARVHVEGLVNQIIPHTRLKEYLVEDTELELSILLTNDKRIQALNKEYRQKNNPTNVLSFPANDNIRIEGFVVLGDVILSYQTIKKESEEQNKKFEDHLAHLLLHSILHLIGYDHVDEKDAEEMEGLEIKILKKLDIDNPYI